MLDQPRREITAREAPLTSLHSAFVPLKAQGAVVTFSGVGHAFCDGDVEVGKLWPKTNDPTAVPAQLISS